MSDFRVTFAHQSMGVLEDWINTKENPVTMIPRQGDLYQTMIDGKLIVFDVLHAIWSEQHYVMIILNNARNVFTGEPVEL